MSYLIDWQNFVNKCISTNSWLKKLFDGNDNSGNSNTNNKSLQGFSETSEENFNHNCEFLQKIKKTEDKNNVNLTSSFNLRDQNNIMNQSSLIDDDNSSLMINVSSVDKPNESTVSENLELDNSSTNKKNDSIINTVTGAINNEGNNDSSHTNDEDCKHDYVSNVNFFYSGL